MTMQNLAIVFGPTLFGQPAPAADPSSSIADAPHQNQVSKIPRITFLKWLDLVYYTRRLKRFSIIIPISLSTNLDEFVHLSQLRCVYRLLYYVVGGFWLPLYLFL